MLGIAHVWECPDWGARWVGLGSPTTARKHTVLEFFYTGLLVLAFLFIGWFSCYVVYKLYEGQR